ncbi:MAG: hypothetical protein AAFV78_17180 [Bacteroidota bacterium]
MFQDKYVQSQGAANPSMQTMIELIKANRRVCRSEKSREENHEQVLPFLRDV